MSLTKVSYSMITGAQYNVLDYGASPSNTAAQNNAAFAAAIAAAKVYAKVNKETIEENLQLAIDAQKTSKPVTLSLPWVA